MPKITLAVNGKTYEVPSGTSFLDFCEENGADHPFGCTEGICGTCACELVQGADNVNPITEAEQDTLESVTDVAGARLGCQLTVLGDIEVKPVH